MSRKGDGYTKLLRRRASALYKKARESDWQDKNVDGPQGCSDSYDKSQRLWSAYRDTLQCLDIYLEFKGWL